MPFDWKITRNRKTEVTTLQVFDPGGHEAASGTGKDIWEAREKALKNAANVEVEKFITAHLFPDIE